MEKTPLEKQKEQIELLKRLLSRDKEEIWKQMPPEKRALYERTIALQKKIGKGEFDVVKAIRKLRGYDN
jgi:hypothetical protein